MANAGYRSPNWRRYFDNLGETPSRSLSRIPSREQIRDRIFRRWLQVEMVQRLSGRRWLRFSDDEAAAAVQQRTPHRIALFRRRCDQRCCSRCRSGVARALHCRRLRAGVSRIAEMAAPWAAYPRVLQVCWVDGRLQISGTVQLSDVGRPGAGLLPEISSSRSQRPDIVEEAEAIFAEMPEEPT